MKDLLQNLKYKILNNKNDILNIVLFSIIIILLSFFTANHTTFFTDKGRELLIPQEILNGQVPYKDILLIYFPLTYYINAFFYKILGVSLNTLIITQTFFCIIFISIFYFCAKMFIDRKSSFALTLLVLPEGNMINFLFERHVNMKCFMMDRLYHDAYGETKAMEMIKNANNDYIIIVEGFDLNLFQTPFLYEKNENLVSKYIENNYHKEEEYEFEYGLITILKRQDKI